MKLTFLPSPNEEIKTYSHKDLQELQSKLTLVAGDKQKENTEIIQTFNKVTLIIPMKERSVVKDSALFDSRVSVVHIPLQCSPLSLVDSILGLAYPVAV